MSGAELEAALARAYDSARAAWPALALSPRAFNDFVAQRLDGGDPLAALSSSRVDELYLCCACLAGSRPAIAELERQYVGPAAQALGRLGLSADEREEALQRARTKLLTGGPDGVPKLAHYSGQGSLAAWLRVVIVRSALNTRRSERRQATREDEVLARRIASEADAPELELMRARYSESLAKAVALGFRRLTSEQRNLLRLYVIDGLTLSELGRMHAVDASTVSRWLARIRARLLDEAKSGLLARHALRPSECDSLMRVVQSDLFVSVERLLQTEPSDSADG